MRSIDEVYAALKAAGAPVSTCEDFERLYQGRMADILDFVSTHVQGRKAVNSARSAIQTHRERGRSSATTHDDIDPLHTRVQRASARVNSTAVTLDRLEEVRKEQSRVMTDLEDDAAVLQNELEGKRLTVLLLSVLERKESIRKARFKEILRLLDELREKSKRTSTLQESQNCTLKSPESNAKFPHAEYTRDALAALQAHSVRLAHLSSLARDGTLASKTKAAEARLLNTIAHTLDLNADDPEVILAHEKCLVAAKSRARHNIEYRSPLPTSPAIDDLYEVSERIAQKEAELQDLADQASALTLACAQALQASATFTQKTAPELIEALKKEASSAQGYVDALRLSVVNRTSAPSSEAILKDRNLSQGRTFSQTLADIESMFTKTQETESFLKEVEKLVSPNPAVAESHRATADSYAQAEAEVSDKVRKLLERKAAKADAGRILIEDIERLIAEVAIIAGTAP
ncbi:hypothetical protein BD414DRAFT_454863 [Trametes punicea]|nr:hypothetical protein BD414DRAFT_454863 [Trametes punicea]